MNFSTSCCDLNEWSWPLYLMLFPSRPEGSSVYHRSWVALSPQAGVVCQSARWLPEALCRSSPCRLGNHVSKNCSGCLSLQARRSVCCLSCCGFWGRQSDPPSPSQTARYSLTCPTRHDCIRCCKVTAALQRPKGIFYILLSIIIILLYYYFLIWTGTVHNKSLPLYITRRDALHQVLASCYFHLKSWAGRWNTR